MWLMRVFINRPTFFTVLNNQEVPFDMNLVNLITRNVKGRNKTFFTNYELSAVICEIQESGLLPSGLGVVIPRSRSR